MKVDGRNLILDDGEKVDLICLSQTILFVAFVVVSVTMFKMYVYPAIEEGALQDRLEVYDGDLSLIGKMNISELYNGSTYLTCDSWDERAIKTAVIDEEFICPLYERANILLSAKSKLHSFGVRENKDVFAVFEITQTFTMFSWFVGFPEYKIVLRPSNLSNVSSEEFVNSLIEYDQELLDMVERS